MNYLDGKRILVTGVCGTVGSELLKVLIDENVYRPVEVVGIDNNESELFFLSNRYAEEPRANFFLADVRDKPTMSRVMQGIDVVFHAAAYKHVTLCEQSPFEAVQTNICGVQNIIQAATENDVSKVIFTSSDKAVNPTSVMGTSKLMGERLITAACITNSKKTVFVSTRFGNVLGSSGSVLPVFCRQIAQGGPVTLTDPRMTRFVMTIRQAAQLVIDSGALAQGGEVFITKMPVMRIRDLAEVLIEILAPYYGHEPESIKIREIGVKPGEKLYEELMSGEETRRAMELEKYFVVLPAFMEYFMDVEFSYPGTVSASVDRPYLSSDEPCMDRDQLKRFLETNRLLPEPVCAGGGN